MDSVKQFLKDNLHIEEHEIKEYFEKNRMRIIVCCVVFFVELLFVIFAMKSTNWKSRGIFGKTFCFVWILFGLILFEALRFIDPLINKYSGKKSKSH